jgi:hypothetical protein
VLPLDTEPRNVTIERGQLASLPLGGDEAVKQFSDTHAFVCGDLTQLFGAGCGQAESGLSAHRTSLQMTFHYHYRLEKARKNFAGRQARKNAINELLVRTHLCRRNEQ